MRKIEAVEQEVAVIHYLTRLLEILLTIVNIVNISVFNALSIGSGLVAAACSAIKRGVI